MIAMGLLYILKLINM